MLQRLERQLAMCEAGRELLRRAADPALDAMWCHCSSRCRLDAVEQPAEAQPQTDFGQSRTTRNADSETGEPAPSVQTSALGRCPLAEQGPV